MKNAVSANKKRPKVFIGSLITLMFVVAFSVSSDTVNRYLQQITAYQWDKVSAELINPKGDPLKSFRLVDQHYNVDFRYQYKANEYQGHLVSLAVRDDKPYEEWRRIAHRVRFWHNEGSLQAYVNPSDPTEAVLDPGLIISDAAVVLVMLLTFAFSSLWGIYSSALGDSPSRNSKSLQKDGIPGNSLKITLLLFSLGVALVVGAVGSAIGWSNTISFKEVINLVMVLPFLLFGATLIYWSYKSYLDYRILGPINLKIFNESQLEEIGVLEKGGTLEQRIAGGHFYLDVNAVEPIDVELECTHVYSTDDHNSVSKKVLWKERRRCRIEPIKEPNQQSYKISFVFILPDNLPGTGRYSGNRGRIEWNASCSGKVTPRHSTTSILFARSWTVPVQPQSDIQSSASARTQTEQASQHKLITQLQREMPIVAAPEVPVIGAKQTLNLHQDRKGIHIISSGKYALWIRALALLPGIGIIAFSAFIAFVGWLMPEVGLMIAGGVGGVIGLSVMILSAMFTGLTLKTTATPNLIKKKHYIFGIPVRHKRVATEAPNQLTLEYRPLMKSDPNGFGIARYLVNINNQVESVAQGIITKEMAETMLYQLRAGL